MKTSRSIHLVFLMIILSYILLLLGLSNYFLGFHDMDLATNHIKLGKQFNFSLDEIRETTTGNRSLTVEELYLQGVERNKMSMAYFIASGMFLAGSVFLVVKSDK